MMRSTLPFLLILLSLPSGQAQQAVRQVPAAAQTSPGIPATTQAAAIPQRPFPPLSAQEQGQLQQLLAAWEATSNATKTLSCRFERWSYMPNAAPNGVHASKSTGDIQYAAPDKGSFKVQDVVFYAGMNQEKQPVYASQPGRFGEWWVCNGAELRDFDRTKKQCTVLVLPPEMRGQRIFNSPLPFIFSLDAQQIQQRYWVRARPAPKPGVILIEAWTKRQSDRAEYKLVQIALDQQTFLPKALVMYAPNFDAKTNPSWQHYEFVDVKHNSVGQRFQQWVGSWIDERPPSDWKILREQFPAANPGGIERAAQTPVTPARR